jgi:hypothetical protein
VDAVAFRLSDWRESVVFRRETIRELIRKAVSDGRSAELLLDGLKRAVGYDLLSDKDKNSFNVMATQARMVVRGWKRVPSEMQAGFLEGRIPYSTVYKEIV